MVDFVTHVQGSKGVVGFQSHKKVGVGVATHVKVSRHLLHRKLPSDPAPLLILNRSFCLLILLVDIWLLQKLKRVAINVLTSRVKPVFLDGPDIGMVTQHDVLQVKG